MELTSRRVGASTSPAAPDGLEGVVGDLRAGEPLGVAQQDAGDVERNVAVADDEHARAVDADRVAGDLGVAVVPGDGLGGAVHAVEVLALDAEPTVLGRADPVDDGVVVLEQLGVADVAADLDVHEQRGARVLVRPGERVADPLGLAVVGGHARAEQTAGHRQTVDEGDVGVGRGEQLAGGVGGCRTCADDRHAQAGGDAGAHPGVRLLLRDRSVGALGVVGGVELGEDLLASAEDLDRLDGRGGAGVGARAAVDAGARVDVEDVRVAEVGLARGRVDAVDGADLDAGRVGAAALGDREGHGRIRACGRGGRAAWPQASAGPPRTGSP